MMNTSLSSSLMSASSVWSQIKAGSSLDKAISRETYGMEARAKGAVQSLVYQTARNRVLVSWLVAQLASKQPSDEVASLLEVALAQALTGKEKTYTLVNETVNAAKRSDQLKRAANFVNAVLRRFFREKDALLKKAESIDQVRLNAPQWWIDQYRKVFADKTAHVFEVQKKHPPLTLRVNRRKLSQSEYLEKLAAQGIHALPVGAEGVVLTDALGANQIPGFNDGEVSVQDAGSQLAAQLLNPKDGMRVLDACAAPGGKTGHLLEIADIDLTAIEKDSLRAPKIKENLDRLGLQANVLVTDAGKLEKWWDKKPFDRILLDAPCSASGIVRRHPDIPWLKNRQDIIHLSRTQRFLMDAMWRILAKKGIMLYAVCSVLPDEGVEQIKRFVADHEDARLVPFEGAEQGYITLSPEESEPTKNFIPWVRDGFFYALLEKI